MGALLQQPHPGLARLVARLELVWRAAVARREKGVLQRLRTSAEFSVGSAKWMSESARWIGEVDECIGEVDRRSG